MIMNKAIVMGRLTKDPEIRTTQSQIPVASYTLAVDRRFKSSDGQKQADFIPIIAWRKLAELSGQYLKKGSKVVIVGSIQTRTYDDKDGKRIYVTEVVAEEIHFAESKKNEVKTTKESFPQDMEYYATADEDNELPFDL